MLVGGVVFVKTYCIPLERAVVQLTGHTTCKLDTRNS